MRTLVSNKQDKVLQFFLDNPTTEIHLRKLSRETKVSLPWVRKTVEELLKQELVTRRRMGGLVLIRANRDNGRFTDLKMCTNLRCIWSSGLVPFLAEKFGEPETICLFGSYSRGEDIERSDIDIAVITHRRVEFDLSGFEKKLRRPVHILRISRDKIQKEFHGTLANGIVLYGHLQ